MRPRCTTSHIALLGLTLLLPAIASAQELPPNLRAAILLRAVAYERHFGASSGDASLAVVDPGSGSGADHAAEMAQAFATLADKMRVADRRLHVLRVTGRSASKTARKLQRRNVELLYLAAPDDPVQRELAEHFAERQTLVLCRKMAPGCMVSAEADGSRPRLVVDVGHTRASNLSFDSRVLRLARVVR
ncbi:MAG: YfiR family protein [Myxococcota bacterium]